MYYFFLGAVLLPIAPSELNIIVGSKNETLTLVNDTDINIIKGSSLRDISFDFMIPSQKYPFALYNSGVFLGQTFFIEYLKKLKDDKDTFQFIVTRMSADNKKIYHFTNIKCVLEDFSIYESADFGSDIMASVKLKEYKDYKTQTISVG